jgi:hypothetical protein
MGAAHYLPLIQKLIEMRQEQPNGIIAAFTATSRGQGVTYVVESLAWQLSQHTSDPLLLCAASSMAGAAQAEFWDPQRIQRLGKGRSRQAAFKVPEWEDLQTLRRKFGFVLVDCPPMHDSTSALLLAKLVDGVALVVGAGEVRREEIESAKKALEGATANLLALVLNKRTDPVPRLFAKFL